MSKTDQWRLATSYMLFICSNRNIKLKTINVKKGQILQRSGELNTKVFTVESGLMNGQLKMSTFPLPLNNNYLYAKPAVFYWSDLLFKRL